MFRRFSSLSKKGLGSLDALSNRPAKQAAVAEDKPTITRRGPQRSAYGDTELESRAVHDVDATLPERIVIKELERRREDFEFQSSSDGGRLYIEGLAVDFIVYSRNPNVIIDVLSDWDKPPLSNENDMAFKQARLESLGYYYGFLWDQEDIYPSRQRLEQKMDEILGRSI